MIRNQANGIEKRIKSSYWFEKEIKEGFEG